MPIMAIMVSTFIHTHRQVYIYIYTYIMYIHIYMHTYTHTHIYIYAHIFLSERALEVKLPPKLRDAPGSETWLLAGLLRSAVDLKYNYKTLSSVKGGVSPKGPGSYGSPAFWVDMRKL